MNIELAAVHEAGHAVIQWLTGGPITYLRLRIEGDEALEPKTGCPDPIRYPDVASIRRRLVMLFAGNAATRFRWPDSSNDSEDWDAAVSATVSFLGGTITRGANGKYSFSTEQQVLLDDTWNRAAEMVEDPILREAIDSIAATLCAATPDVNGMIAFSGAEIVQLCEGLIGEEYRRFNPWTSWLTP